jgi:putative transposase
MVDDRAAHGDDFGLMARKLRIQHPGAVYHLMNRGNRRESIFADDADRHEFLVTLAQVCQKADWRARAFCLMKNHFHLVGETPQANLVVGMKWLLRPYTSRFNRRHRVFGHLFSGRSKAPIVDGSGKGYFKGNRGYLTRLLQRRGQNSLGPNRASYDNTIN